MFKVALSHEVAAGPLYKNIKTIELSTYSINSRNVRYYV